MPRTDGITRRDAVKAAGAAGIALGAAKAIKGEAPAYLKSVHAANNQIAYGIIGTGGRGQYLLGLLKGVDTGHCVAICDISDEALKKGELSIGSSPKKYKDYRQLLADNSVEAVMIAVPVYLHYPMVEDALRAGKHVFCEKSLVFNPEEVHKLRKLYPSQFPKQVLQVGLQRRYSEFYNMVRQMIDKDVLGDVKFMYAQWHRNPGWVMKPEGNWRLKRATSGGIAAELASHHFDVADWMFGSTPEMVMGLGGHDTIFDGRDIYDNIQLVFKYPKGKKLMWSGSSTTSHLSLFGGARTEQGEMICGTKGTVHITIGDGKMDAQPPLAIWFREPNPPAKVTPGKKEEFKAGATFALAAGGRALPVLLSGDEMKGNESFLEKEMKFARRWLYSKNVMVPTESKNPVTTSLESFFNDCKTLGKPRSNVEVGLHDSIAVILSNLSMDEERRVQFSEIEKLGNPDYKAPAPAAGKKQLS
jgi:predicted dehydrogenase